MNRRDGHIEGFIDKMIPIEEKNNRRTLNHAIPLEDVIDKIQTEDLVDDILRNRREINIKAFDDKKSITNTLLYSSDLMVSNGFFLLQATGLLPEKKVRPRLRIRILTLPYLFGALSLITIGTILILFHKMNKYLFTNIIK